MRILHLTKYLGSALVLLVMPAFAAAQQTPVPPATTPPRADTTQPAAVRLSIDEAIRLALQHNHALLAARTTILQNQALETTANLRPNPVLSLDSQFLPIFQPSAFSASYIDNTAQFDAGIAYTFERGKKRQHRLQAAKDVTAVSRYTVADNERQLIFNVAQQFVAVLLA